MIMDLRGIAALFVLITGSIEACQCANAADARLLPGTHVTFDLPSDSVVSRSDNQPTFAVQPLGIKIRVEEGGRDLYDLQRKVSKHSARAFRRGTLARSDTYLYFWWPGSAVDKTGRAIEGGGRAEFHLVLSRQDQVAAIVVDVPRPAIDSGKTKVQDIEALLATARLVPANAGAEKE